MVTQTNPCDISIAKTHTAPETIQVSVVSNLEDYMACMAVRSAAFLARGEPYEEEFDQNDLISTTHLLAKRGRTPIGTMRIRLLTASNGGIASWERLAILPNAGNAGPKVLMHLARTARAYSEFKGISSVIGAVENPKLLKFWQKHGFELMDAPPSVYNNVEYLQIRLKLKSDRFTADDCAEPALFDSLNGSIELADFNQYMSAAPAGA